MVTVHFGEVIGGVAKMGDEIVTGSRRAQIPRHLSRRHGERREQSARAMTDVLILASPSFPRLGLLGRVFRMQNLHPRLLVAADDQFAVLVELGCVDIQLTDPLSFGVEIGIMAVEPVDTLVRLEVEASSRMRQMVERLIAS